jgi:hypothetical protein
VVIALRTDSTRYNPKQPAPTSQPPADKNPDSRQRDLSYCRMRHRQATLLLLIRQGVHRGDESRDLRGQVKAESLPPPPRSRVQGGDDDAARRLLVELDCCGEDVRCQDGPDAEVGVAAVDSQPAE